MHKYAQYVVVQFNENILPIRGTIVFITSSNNKFQYIYNNKFLKDYLHRFCVEIIIMS